MEEIGISITNDGARQLMAAILKQAHEDYIQDQCPDWCPVINTCMNKNKPKECCDAKKFIHSAWCATLCDGLNIEHVDFVNTTIDKASVSKETFKYIESELRNYKQSCTELENMKRNIILAAPIIENPEGKSYETSNSTMAKATKILNDRKIYRLNSTVDAIKTVYSQCGKDKQELIRLKYWENKYKDTGIMDVLGIERATFYRWRKAIVLNIAVKLGYL